MFMYSDLSFPYAMYHKT